MGDVFATTKRGKKVNLSEPSPEMEYITDMVAEATNRLADQEDRWVSKTELSKLWALVEDRFAEKAGVRTSLDALTSRTEGTETLTSEVTISATDVKALNATPQTLVLSPGAGKSIEVEKIEAFLDYESAAYTVTAGEDFSFSYATAGEFGQLETTGFLDQTSDQRRCWRPSGEYTPGDNEDIEVSILTGEVTTGDSPVKFRVVYKIINQLT